MAEFKPLFPVTYGVPDSPTGILSYHICSDGLYMTKKVMGSGYVTVKVEGMSGAPKGEDRMRLLHRKIPFPLYQQTVEFFRYVEKHFGKGNLEAFVLIGYCPSTDNYFLYVPDQIVTAASVKYDPSEFWKKYPHSYIICDIHSHNHMSAFWSGTDDNDDKKDRFSMVIGKIGQLIPDYKLRFSCGKQRFDYTLDDVFADGSESFVLNFDEAIKNINIIEQRPMNDPLDCFPIYRKNEGYNASGSTGSLYNMIKNNLQKKREFSITELMGDNW